jgi:hypothetical protein
VLAAPKQYGIPWNRNRSTHAGQLSFDYDCRDYHLVKNQAEQSVIRLIRQYRAVGLSLRQIARQLNDRLVHT